MKALGMGIAGLVAMNTDMGIKPSSVQTHHNMILQTNTHARQGDEYNKSGGLIKNLVWFWYSYERTFYSVQPKQLPIHMN